METIYNATATLKWENEKIQNLKCDIHIDKDSWDFFNINMRIPVDSFHK